ncbi:hypothetical protein [Neoactinobaculum massilliense]|uniref:hypothetical protein n=1 Tax=Neoactinobaculum massilliense TaxID=2364794 RepID=UPI0013DDA6C6|nr:hypothetical protein [Neoactinobaculum massilliense]
MTSARGEERGDAPKPQAPDDAAVLLDSLDQASDAEQIDILERVAEALGRDLGRAR